jgi:hypothetical protein
VKCHFIDAEFFPERRKNPDQWLANGSGADDVHNLFLAHGVFRSDLDARF